MYAGNGGRSYAEDILTVEVKLAMVQVVLMAVIVLRTKESEGCRCFNKRRT